MLEYQEDMYALLGVEDNASSEDIRKAYLKLAKKLHPDRFPNDVEKRAAAQAEFSRVTRAHDVLSDPKQREEYDAIRLLAKNRSNLENGEATSAPSSASPPAADKIPESANPNSRDSWAQKHYERAADLLRKKRFPEAETAIREAIRLNPQSATFYSYLAEIQLARGWKTLAASSVQTALTIDPKNHEAKQLELRMKASSSVTGAKPKGQSDKKDEKPGEKKGFLDQLKGLLNKKV